MPAVGIVEDHLLLAETLCAALQSRGICGRILPPAPLAELSRQLHAVPVDLVLLDLDLGPYGSDSTPLIASLVSAGMRVLVVTGSTDRLLIASALEQGAIGVQPKAAGFAELIDTATAALTASGPLHLERRTHLLDELRRARLRRERDLKPFRELTAREAETLRALTAGHSVADIAAHWVVSEATVRSHVRGILSKLGVSSQLAAVAAAVSTGWVTAGVEIAAASPRDGQTLRRYSPARSRRDRHHAALAAGVRRTSPSASTVR